MVHYLYLLNLAFCLQIFQQVHKLQLGITELHIPDFLIKLWTRIKFAQLLTQILETILFWTLLSRQDNITFPWILQPNISHANIRLKSCSQLFVRADLRKAEVKEIVVGWCTFISKQFLQNICTGCKCDWETDIQQAITNLQMQKCCKPEETHCAWAWGDQVTDENATDRQIWT